MNSKFFQLVYSYVYYLTCGFIAANCASNFLTRAFNPSARVFNLATPAFCLLTRGFELVTRGFELVTLRFEPVTRVFLFHNLNSISAHNYSKATLRKAYLTVHKLDIVCLSETCFNSNTAPDNDDLEISGNNLIRSDHLSNCKRGGVCIYCKRFLHLRVLDIQYLHECINIELKIGNSFVLLLLCIDRQVNRKMNLKTSLRNLN